MGRHSRGDYIEAQLTTENRVTLTKIDVSLVSCYIEQNSIRETTVSVVNTATGIYKAGWQTSDSTPLGTHSFKFVFTKDGKRAKRCFVQVID